MKMEKQEAQLETLDKTHIELDKVEVYRWLDVEEACLCLVADTQQHKINNLPQLLLLEAASKHFKEREEELGTEIL
jgi:hypothetical protein